MGVQFSPGVLSALSALVAFVCVTMDNFLALSVFFMQLELGELTITQIAYGILLGYTFVFILAFSGYLLGLYVGLEYASLLGFLPFQIGLYEMYQSGKYWSNRWEKARWKRQMKEQRSPNNVRSPMHDYRIPTNQGSAESERRQMLSDEDEDDEDEEIAAANNNGGLQDDVGDEDGEDNPHRQGKEQENKNRNSSLDDNNTTEQEADEEDDDEEEEEDDDDREVPAPDEENQIELPRLNHRLSSLQQVVAAIEEPHEEPADDEEEGKIHEENSNHSVVSEDSSDNSSEESDKSHELVHQSIHNHPMIQCLACFIRPYVTGETLLITMSLWRHVLEEIAIFAPLLASNTITGVLLIVCVFYVCVCLQCYVAYVLVRYEQFVLVKKIHRYSKIIIPWLCLGLGMYILSKSILVKSITG